MIRLDSPRRLAVLTSLGLVLLAALLVASGYLLVKQREASRQVSRTITRHHESVRLTDELHQSSEDLTSMVRSYAVTGDPAFKKHFYTILEIRDGRAPRPVGYSEVFWDFVVAGDLPAPESGAGDGVSLRELMEQAGFSDEELQLLTEAKRRSDSLVEFEEVAMNAIEGRFQDAAGAFRVIGDPARELALQLLFGEEYHEQKSAVMKPLNEALERVDERTSAALAAAQEDQARLASSLVFLQVAIAVVLPLFLVAGYRYHRSSVARWRASEKRLRSNQQRLRDLAADQTVTEERERFRVSRELHEGAVQDLALARMQLDTAIRRRGAGEQVRALEEVSESLRWSALSVNRIAADLSSPSLEELGLATAISEWMKRALDRDSGIETALVNELQKKDADQLDFVTRASLLRIVRELLANVVQHAQASKVTILMKHVGERLELVVRDDGAGCDLGQILTNIGDKAGLGLFGIRERMMDLGGELQLESAPGQGFTATLVLPCFDAEPASGPAKCMPHIPETRAAEIAKREAS